VPVDGPTVAGDRVQVDSREVDSLEDGLTAALFRAAVSRAAACRVAAGGARAVPVLGACGQVAPAVPVQGAPAGDEPQVAADVRRCLLRVLLPAQDDCRVAV
jgi:hypothetical protein